MQNVFNIQLSTPIMTSKQFAEVTGKEERKVKRQMSAGMLPYIQFADGGERFVNVLEIALKASKESAFKFQGVR